MCQTTLISNNIVRLGTRSYRQRMEVMNPNTVSVAQLSRLNRDLEAFYELLYDQWDTVTKEEYMAFGPQLVTMLQTLKELYLTCKKFLKGDAMNKQIELLGMNYAAIFEVNSDMVNFRIESAEDQQFENAINEASKRINNGCF